MSYEHEAPVQQMLSGRSVVSGPFNSAGQCVGMLSRNKPGTVMKMFDVSGEGKVALYLTNIFSSGTTPAKNIQHFPQ
jgi:hypothetical protein